jgi:hypothetical protein
MMASEDKTTPQGTEGKPDQPTTRVVTNREVRLALERLLDHENPLVRSEAHLALAWALRETSDEWNADDIRATIAQSLVSSADLCHSDAQVDWAVVRFRSLALEWLEKHELSRGRVTAAKVSDATIHDAIVALRRGAKGRPPAGQVGRLQAVARVLNELGGEVGGVTADAVEKILQRRTRLPEE